MIHYEHSCAERDGVRDNRSMAAPSRAAGAYATGTRRIVTTYDRHGDIVEVEVINPATAERKGPLRAEHRSKP